MLSLVKHDLPVFLRSYLTNWLYETVNHFFIIDIGVKQSLFAFLISNYVLTLFSGNFHRFIDIWDEQPRFAGNDSNFKRRPECKNWSARKRRRTAVKLWRVKEKGIWKLLLIQIWDHIFKIKLNRSYNNLNRIIILLFR